MKNVSFNSVELRGRAGTVRISPGGESIVANFSLMTEYEQKTVEGKTIIDACWHNVAAFQSENVCLDGLTRGSLVHLEGRLRNCRYTAVDGSERMFTEIIASSLKVVE